MNKQILVAAGAIGIFVVINAVFLLSTPPIEPSDQPIKQEQTTMNLQDGLASKSTEIIVNGRALTEAELADFEQRYGARPAAGNYWYDSRSGLYGVAGSGAVGFMYPGHSYGTVSRSASNGNTGVLINGRELTQSEYQFLNSIAGIPVPPGSYWLDANGNAGITGDNTPLINLYTASQALGGGDGGGDNGWASRFSSGNYNSDNSAGYVSMPGMGVIGSYGL